MCVCICVRSVETVFSTHKDENPKKEDERTKTGERELKDERDWSWLEGVRRGNEVSVRMMSIYDYDLPQPISVFMSTTTTLTLQTRIKRVFVSSYVPLFLDTYSYKIIFSFYFDDI